ncbi:hypothetical protein I4U23_001395 [Adineta vaga]|nr:hypothetical protein I4U23_001395 [Adineta vaga]
MATAKNRKTSCVICQKVAGIFTCRGCGNDFCYRHVAVHRQELSKEMEDLTNNHNLLQQTIHEQKVDPNRHPLIEEINVWEQESIEKIHQAASDARRQVITVTNTDHTKLLEDLHSLATVLSTARNEDDYVETDLKEWKEKLEELNTIFSADEMIRFNQDDTENSLISKIFCNHPSHDIFFQTTGDMQISEQGKVITHGPTNRAAAARCKGEYSLK